MKKTVRIGSRGSALAMYQTNFVKATLEKQFPDYEITIEIIKTEGDIDRNSPLASFEGRGAFVKSIENALLKNDVDIAVHSLKDLPSELPEGLTLGAVPDRTDVRDVLATADGSSLMDLPAGSIVGTGSERREKQAASLRPDLEYKGIRGNVGTRIGKIGEGYDAVMLAAAGLKRLGLEDKIGSYFDVTEIVPAPCQGAIGIECRSDDSETLEMLAAIEITDMRVCVDIERTFIATLGMGCHTPVGAYALPEDGKYRFNYYVLMDENKAATKGSILVDAENAADAVSDLALDIRNDDNL